MNNFLDFLLWQILDLRHLWTPKLIVNFELKQNNVWHNAVDKFKCVKLTTLCSPKFCSKLIQIFSSKVFLI